MPKRSVKHFRATSWLTATRCGLTSKPYSTNRMEKVTCRNCARLVALDVAWKLK